MLRNETLQQLKALRLSGFADALEEQYASMSFEELSFDERLGLLVDREVSKRKSSKIERFIRQARFQNSEACVENIHYHSERKLDRKLILELASCQYIHHARNINIFGATGAGKSYVGQALGQAACRMGLATRYIHLPDLLEELKMARQYGPERWARKRKEYINIPLLILDEFLLFKIDEMDCQNLLQIIDRRSSKRSTIVITQYNPDEWISQMPIQVAAEAITDRLTAQAYSIVIESKESMRNVGDKDLLD